jgi:hypothetical protein
VPSKCRPMTKKVGPERVGSPHNVEPEGAEAEPPASVPRGGEVSGNDFALEPVFELIELAGPAAGLLALRVPQLAAATGRSCVERPLASRSRSVSCSLPHRVGLRELGGGERPQRNSLR